MTKPATTARKEQARRARLRSLMPGAPEVIVGQLARVPDPVERIGAAICWVNSHRHPNTDWLARLAAHRAEVVNTVTGIDEQVSSLTKIIRALHGDGAPADRIDRHEKRRLHLLVGWLGDLASASNYLWAEQPEQPDDRSYRPRHVDPVLRGAARATGQTAAAVRRGRTVTDWQHTEREADR